MKNWFKIIIILFIVCIVVVFVSRQRILTVSKGHIFDKGSAEQIHDCQNVMILGAGVRDNGSMSPILEERAITAKDLYDNKKACKIFISGHLEEVEAVKEYLVNNGISQEIIQLDDGGFDTFASMQNMKDKYGVNNIIIITQDFHLPRAVYIARELSIDADGYIAYKFYPYIMLEEYKYIIRDWLASVKAVVQVQMLKNNYSIKEFIKEVNYKNF